MPCQSCVARCLDEAIPLYLTAIDTALAAEGPLSPTAVDIRLALAWHFLVSDRRDESGVHRQAALAALRASGGAGEIRAALVETKAIAFMFAGMSPRQIAFKEASDAIERNRLFLASRGPLMPATIKASVDKDLGMLYAEWGNTVLAEPLTVESAALLTANAESPYERSHLAFVQGMVAMLIGRHDDASRFFNEVIDLRRRTGDGQHPWAASDFDWAARNLAMERKFDEAESLLSSVPAFEELKGGGTGAAGISRVIPKARAFIKLERGDAQAALKLLPPEATDGPPSLPFDDTQLRGEVFCALGRRSEGLERLDRALNAQEGQVSEFHPALARARAVTGLCALSAGQRDRAKALAALARQAFAVQPRVSPYFKQPSEQLDRVLASRAAQR